MSEASKSSAGKQFGVLAFNLAIAAWCAYDLFLAAEPGNPVIRAFNYIAMIVTLIVAGAAAYSLARK